MPGTCILGWQQKSRSNEILIEYYYCHTANALLLARHPPSILGHRLGQPRAVNNYDSEKVVVRVVYGNTRPQRRAFFAVFDSGAIEELSFGRVAADYGEKTWR